jgi:hypothetical protein
MPSSLTVAKARALLYRYVDPQDINSAEFLPTLNQVCDEFISDGTYMGCVLEGYFTGDTDGHITLPSDMSSILAATRNHWPVRTYSQFHQFVEQGPGTIDRTKKSVIDFFDLGDEFCTNRDIPAGSSGVLRTTIHSVTDVDKLVRYTGLDANGNEIFDATGVPGEEVELANPTVDTVNVFSKVTGVIKEVTVARIDMGWMDGATLTPLSTYAPNEDIPLYKRYQIGKFNEEADPEQVIGIKARRRFVPMLHETDFVPIDSIRALKLGLKAIEHEDQNMHDVAIKEWARAYDILNKRHKAARGAAIYTVNFKPTGGRFTNMH